jgi:hypothetical protein
MAPWTATIREKGKGKRLARLRGSFPSVQGKQPISPLLSKRPSFSENLNGLFSGAFDSLYFRGLEKGKRQNESLQGTTVDQAVFAIQLSILNRMSLLAGFIELGRPIALALLVLSLQLPKRSRSDLR